MLDCADTDVATEGSFPLVLLSTFLSKPSSVKLERLLMVNLAGFGIDLYEDKLGAVTCASGGGEVGSMRPKFE